MDARAFLEIRGEEYDDIEDWCTPCPCDEFKGRPHVELPLNRVVLDGKYALDPHMETSIMTGD
jgi:hypothetical protein